MLSLAALTIAAFSRYMRSSMMEAMTEDYVRTAKAKGASQRRVLYRHALRNALIPLITLLGLSIPGIVGGALITETVFNFPGMGLLTTQAAINNDVPLLLGTTFVAALATVAGSLLADILYAIVDPTGAVWLALTRQSLDDARPPSAAAPGRRRGHVDRRASARSSCTSSPRTGSRSSALVIIVASVLFCFLGPLVYHTNQISTQNALLYSTQNAPPSSGHLLGTDQSGFDIFGRIMYGGQVSLEVGFAAAAIATIIGVLYGAISGFFGGWIDALMMRIVDVLLSVPILFLRDRARGDLPPVADDPDPGHRLIGLARAGAARARRDAVAARARVRARRAGDGRQLGPDRAAPHHPEHDRHDHRQRDVPGRRRDPAARRARLHRPRRARRR